MRRALSNGLAAAAVLVAAGCSTTPIQTPTRSLDRPSDIALVCAILGDNGAVTMLDLDQCSRDNLLQTKSGGRLFMLIANTNRGEVALAYGGYQWSDDPLATDGGVGGIIDLDPENPGFGFIPVGSLPAHVRASQDGRLAVTANQADCNLSVIDVQAAVSIPTTKARAASTSCLVTPVIGDERRPLGARPSWVEVSPAFSTVAPGARGGACGAAGYRAMVAFPACQLVAEIDLGTGKILQALRFTRAGAEVVSDLNSIQCAPECRGGGVLDMSIDTSADMAAGDMAGSGTEDLSGSAPEDLAASVDLGGAGSSDGGTAPLPDLGLPPLLPTDAPYPHTLAVSVEIGEKNVKTDHLFIGDAVGTRITVASFPEIKPAFQDLSAIQLDDSVGGVSRMRLSRRIAVLDNDRFLYAIGRDNVVHVIGVDELRECETNPDPDHLDAWLAGKRADGTLQRALIDELKTAPTGWQYEKTMRCLPVGDPALPRAALATSPGITLPLGALPRDIAFVNESRIPTSSAADVNAPAAAPGILYGDFAFIIGSGGQAYGVNVADLCPQPNFSYPDAPNRPNSCDPQRFNNVNGRPGDPATKVSNAKPRAIDIMPNRLRGGARRFEAPTTNSDTTAGGMRLLDIPLVNGSISQSSLAASNTSPRLCDVSGTKCGALETTAILDYSTQHNLIAFRSDLPTTSEGWRIEWEGALLNRVTAAVGVAGGNGALYDAGAGFCLRGVRPGDKVSLLGCSSNDDCNSDQLCFVDSLSPVGSRGLCVNKDSGDATEVSARIKDGACYPFSVSTLRYRVSEAYQDRLVFEEISMPESPLDTTACTTDGDCKDVVVPIQRGSAFEVLQTACRSVGHGLSQCVVPCTDPKNNNSPCGDGFVCAASQWGGTRCMRAPLPTGEAQRTCFPQLQRFVVRGGDAFLVTGDSTGYLHDDYPDPADPVSGRCMARQPTTGPARLRNGRIPLLFGSAVPPYQRDARTHRCPDGVTDLLAPDLLAGTVLSSCLLPAGGDSCTEGRCVEPDPGQGKAKDIDSVRCYTGLCDGMSCNSDMGQCGRIANLRFDNVYFSVVLSVPRRHDLNAVTSPIHYLSSVPPTGTWNNFTVIGGARGFQFPLGLDVLAQLPRVAVTAPDGTSVYIVDEGKQTTGTGLRGQVLRFFTDTQSTDPAFQVR